MPKDLVIDIGNTLVKFGVFEGSSCVDVYRTENPKLKETLEVLWKEIQNFSGVALVAVADFDASIVKWLEERCRVFIISSESKLPFQNCYKDKETLGSDRLALVAGASLKYPSQSVLIIGMGTCITCDYIDSQGRYHGGTIAPGMQMRFWSLREFTAKLPVVEPNFSDKIFGNTTQSSISCGVLWAIVDEINGTVDRFRTLDSKLKVIITGGDAQFFGKRLKSVIFANPNLLLEGANALMKYNLDEA